MNNPCPEELLRISLVTQLITTSELIDLLTNNRMYTNVLSCNRREGKHLDSNFELLSSTISLGTSILISHHRPARVECFIHKYWFRLRAYYIHR